MKNQILLILFLFTCPVLPTEPLEIENWSLLPEQLYYNVSYYDIDLSIDVNGSSIQGSLGVSGEIIQNNTPQIVLNLYDHMIVDSVKTGSQALPYVHQNHILTIDLPQPLNTGEIFSVRVFYQGYPMGEALPVTD